jgi:hypothetical protein
VSSTNLSLPGLVLRSVRGWARPTHFLSFDSKRPFFSRCNEAALARRDRPLLLMGDLNTGDNKKDLTPGGVPFLRATKFGALGSSGLLDLWRSQHGPMAREYTWSTTKNDLRIDHAFANEAFLDQLGPFDCQYDHQTKGCAVERPQCRHPSQPACVPVGCNWPSRSRDCSLPRSNDSLLFSQ